jgi:hyperosmotically inducible protein
MTLDLIGEAEVSMRTRLGINLTLGVLGLAMSMPAFAQNKPPASQSMHRPGEAAENPVNHTDRGVQIAVKDTTITAQVKAALHQDKEVSNDYIHVSTIAGVVSLKGAVPTKQAAVRAEEIAHQTVGVRGVNNRLTVVSSERIAN